MLGQAVRRIARVLSVLISSALIGAGALPYAAPALCTASGSAMTPHGDAGAGHAASVQADGMGAPCDFAACAIAPAAPPVTPAPMAIAFATAPPATGAPTLGPGPAVAPLTPPPLS